MTLPSPIPSDVFVDGEFTNEIKWYSRIFSKINSVISFLQGQPKWYFTEGIEPFSDGDVHHVVAITFADPFIDTPDVIPYSIDGGNYGMAATDRTETGFNLQIWVRSENPIVGSSDASWAFGAYGILA